MSDPAVLEVASRAAPAGPLAELILVRLLPARASVPPKRLRADVAPLFRDPPSAERVADGVAALRAAGLVTAKGQQLTEAGRARALAYIGAGGLPPRANWAAVKARYLVPKALGLAPGSDEARAAADAGRLAPLLIRRKFGLPDGTPLTLNGVLNALAYQQLGLPVPRAAGPNDIRAAVISRKLGLESPLTGGQLGDDAARLLLGSSKRGAEGLRAVALAGLTGGGQSPAADPSAPPRVEEGFDLETFANTVKAAARRCPTGRFGDNKVFIGHVWRQLEDEPRFARLGLPGFKRKLVEANREDLLTLSRADLVQLMDPADVRESETAYLNAVFHFVLVEKE